MEVPRLITDRAYSTYESMIEREVAAGEMPKHIAIIMDGNRRYAEEVLGADPMEGHKLGRKKLEEVLHWCLELDIHIITVYAFSTENFNRDEDEVTYLMELLEQSLYDFADDPDVHAKKVAIKVIGDMSMLPENVVKAAEYALERTGSYTDNCLNMAIAYSGRQDIMNAVRGIASDVLEGKITLDDIDESMISNYVSTTGLPDPDLVLRTSGEVRVSNFLLWQMAYSELYFTDTNWPDFRKENFYQAIYEYQQRERRFGK